MRDFIIRVVLIYFRFMRLTKSGGTVDTVPLVLHGIWRLDPIRDRIETRSIPHGKREPWYQPLLESTRRTSVITPVAASVGKMFALRRPLGFLETRGEGIPLEFDDTRKKNWFW